MSSLSSLRIIAMFCCCRFTKNELLVSCSAIYRYICVYFVCVVNECTSICNDDSYQLNKRISLVLPLFPFSLYSLPIDLLLQLKSPSQNLATDRDITFVTVCMDIHMHVRIYRYTYNIMQTSNSDCKTRCIISTSISTFSTCVSRGTLSSILKVFCNFFVALAVINTESW